MLRRYQFLAILTALLALANDAFAGPNSSSFSTGAAGQNATTNSAQFPNSFRAPLPIAGIATTGNTPAQNGFWSAGQTGHFYGRTDGLNQEPGNRSLVLVQNGQIAGWEGITFYENFAYPYTSAIQCLTSGTHAAASTTTATSNYCIFADGFTIADWPLVNSSTVPVLTTTASNGLDINATATSTFGMELDYGGVFTAGGTRPYIVGTDPDFYTCCTINPTTAAGVTVAGCGFRDPETNIAAETGILTSAGSGYTTSAFIGDYAGTVKTQSVLAGGTSTLTSTTQTVGNAAAHQFCVYIASYPTRSDGVASGTTYYTLDGATPTVTQSPVMTAGAMLIPMVISKQSVTTSAHVYLQNWQSGFVYP